MCNVQVNGCCNYKYAASGRGTIEEKGRLSSAGAKFCVDACLTTQRPLAQNCWRSASPFYLVWRVRIAAVREPKPVGTSEATARVMWLCVQFGCSGGAGGYERSGGVHAHLVRVCG